ncbi:Cytochrome P450 10 [Armadillidium nasatum]|uniref:Cytochrome P450 10 n=1 Tax=Armadillidium nasatum TaxID=96803 RepID=A0A5N5TJE2_9CRUS|nr:Cytochrome P450 10 [Armadillidium nasatum]
MVNYYVEQAYNGCKVENVDMRTKNSMLYKVIEEGSLDEETIKSVFVDLFLASADTTSHTAGWAFYLLGRNPDVAERARKEILSVLEKEKTLTLETLAKIRYISGIIRETLRLYPTASFLTRKVAADTTLCGYSVPAGTMVISSLYSMGRSPTNFTNPDAFQPERWFPKNSESTDNKERLQRKAYVPWGLGKRSCIGKRTAEIELSLLIMEALKTFEWTVEEEVNMILRMVTVPSKDIKLNLKPRLTEY